MTQHLREHADWLDQVVTATEEGFTLLTEAINELELRVRALEGDDTPAPPAPMFMVGLNSSSPNLNTVQFVRAFKGRGRGGMEWFSPHRYQLVSLKPEALANTAGVIDVTVQAWLEDGREPEDLRLAIWHEPYDNMTVEEWARYQQVLAQKAAQHGFVPVAVFTADAREEWVNVVPATHEVWLDPYDWSEGDEGPWDLFDPRTWTGQRLLASIALLEERGYPWGVAEFGTRHKDQQAQWIHRNVQWLIERGALGVAYFDRKHTERTGKVNDWRLTPEGLEALLTYS